MLLTELVLIPVPLPSSVPLLHPFTIQCFQIGALLIDQADGPNKVWGLGLGFAQVSAFEVLD